MQTTINLACLLRMKEAATYLNISTTTLWRLQQQDPNFPAKVRLTNRCCGYLKSDLDKYLSMKTGGKA